MKCYKPRSDQECILTVCANGLACPEYVLPSQADFSSEPCDVLECFIPVTDGDEITISGTFNGTVLHACFDLLADGSFVVDKRIEGSKTGELRCYKPRKLEYRAVMNVPIPPDWTSIYAPTKVIEGSLGVKKLPEHDAKAKRVIDTMSSDGEQIGVGSIAVVVCLNQESEEMHENAYVSKRCGEWREASGKERKFMGMSHGGIPPTHQLEIRISDDRLHINKQSKHRRHFKQQRFGKQPWATFVFYYRSALALNQAGCVGRPDMFQKLSDFGERFLEVAPREKNRPKKTVDGFGSPKPKIRGAGVTMEDPSPPPMRRRKLFGQQLLHRSEVASNPGSSLSSKSKPGSESSSRHDSPLGSENHDTLFVTQHPGDAKSLPQLEEDQYESFDSSPEKFSSLLAAATSDHGAQIRHQPSLSEEGDILSEVAVPGSLSFTNRQDDDMNAPVARTPLRRRAADTPVSDSLSGKTASENAKQVRFQGKDTSSKPASFSTSNMSLREVSQDEVRAVASDDGLISFKMLVDHCDANGIDQDLGVRRTQEIANMSGSSWIVADPRPAAAKATPPGWSTNGRSNSLAVRSKENTSQATLHADRDGVVAVSSVGPIHEIVDQGLLPPITDSPRPQDTTSVITPSTAANSATASNTAIHDDVVKIKMEPGLDRTPKGRSSPANKSTATPASLLAKPLPVSGLKRPGSSLTRGGSHRETPSKRAKSAKLEALQDELKAEQAKKEKKQRQMEEMKKQIFEKNARKAEKRQLQREQEQRDTERLEREVEAMKQSNVYDDLKLEEMKKQLEEPDDDDDDSDMEE